MTSILGLDIDGVLNDGDVEADMQILNETLCRRLDLLLSLVGDAEVVIVSAWRFHYDLPTLRGMLQQAGLRSPNISMMVGGRQKSNGWDFRYDRFKTEVLSRSPQVQRYAILDDTAGHYLLARDYRGLLYSPGYVAVPEFLRGRIVCPTSGISPKDMKDLWLAFDGKAATTSAF